MTAPDAGSLPRYAESARDLVGVAEAAAGALDAAETAAAIALDVADMIDSPEVTRAAVRALMGVRTIAAEVAGAARAGAELAVAVAVALDLAAEAEGAAEFWRERRQVERADAADALRRVAEAVLERAVLADDDTRELLDAARELLERATGADPLCSPGPLDAAWGLMNRAAAL